MSELTRLGDDLDEIIKRARAARDRLGPVVEVPADVAKPHFDPLAIDNVIPLEHAWASFDALTLLRSRLPWAHDAIAELDRDRPRSVTLIGDAGRGKSSLAAALFRAHYRRGHRFAFAGDVATMRREWPLGEGDPPAFSKLLAAPLVWLDDLGAESNDRDGCIADLVQTRHRHQRATIYTTGIAYGALASKYTTGIARRVFERQTIIDLGGAA